jgi:phage shock protein C
MAESIKKFYRSRTDRIVWGVCGGLGEYFGIDSTLVRILFILLAFGSGSGIVLYLILALIVPSGPHDKTKGSGKVSELAEELSASAQQASGKMRSGDRHHARNFLGLIILTIGLVLMLKEIFQFDINWGLVYPFLIILLGLYFLDSLGQNNK